MVKKPKFQVKSTLSTDMALQITPMASIFTVILVFLLKSVSLSVSNITPSQDLTLPEIKGSDEVFEGTRVEISPKAILVDGKVAVPLQEFNFDPRELTDDGSFRGLTEAISHVKSLNLSEGDKENKVLILADVKTPYSTIKRVFASAANQGLFDLRLVVVEDK